MYGSRRNDTYNRHFASCGKHYGQVDRNWQFYCDVKDSPHDVVGKVRWPRPDGHKVHEQFLTKDYRISFFVLY